MSYLDDYLDDGLLLDGDVDHAQVLQQMLDALKTVKSTIKTASAGPTEEQLRARRAAAMASYGDKGDVYVDVCPPGYLACDGADGECPDEAVYGSVPPMYNAAGEMCYVREGVLRARRSKVNELAKKARKQGRSPYDSRAIDVSVGTLREMVRLAGQLSRALTNVGQMENVGCDTVNGFYPESTEESKKGRRAFCETLLKSDGGRKCQIGANDQCVPAA